MGETAFHDLYSLAKYISVHLPLSDGLPLDKIIDTNNSYSIPSKVPEGKHWAVIARTGCGKTTFDKALLKAHKQKFPYLNTYILDTKKLGDFGSSDGTLHISYMPPPALSGIGQSQVWQPIVDDLEAYSDYFTNILRKGKPAIVLVDESKNLKFGGKAPRGYELLLSQGRMPGISVITNYQEIANGLRQGLSQATNVVAFGVSNSYDEWQVKDLLHLDKKHPLPLKGVHSFLHINSDKSSRPTLYSGYRQFIPQFMNW